MSMKMDFGKIVSSMSPALIAAPALATVDVNIYHLFYSSFFTNILIEQQIFRLVVFQFLLK
jgi:hypothetical protein